jgi:hypothetical protein
MRLLVLARLQYPQAVQGVKMMPPSAVDSSRVVGEESLQPESEARHTTGRDFYRFRHLPHYTEEQPQSSSRIAFHRQRLDVPRQGTMLNELVRDPLLHTRKCDLIPLGLLSPNLKVGVLRRTLDKLVI